MQKHKAVGYLRLVLFVGILLLIPQVARAVPSYARQTGMSCIACHTEFPLLNEFGRQFKLDGYVLSTGDTNLPPLAVMLQPSFTRTNKNQFGGAAPHFAENSNFALNQASLFYSGRLFGPYAEAMFGAPAAGFLNKIGTFMQMTYDGVGQRLSWDNVEIRYADAIAGSTMPITYGIYLNNNPGLQDPWNSAPVWGFPFSSSGLGPTPAAATLLEGGLAQQVGGLGAYVMLSHSIYIDIAGYHTLSRSVQKAMGVAPEGETQVPGVAPYLRVAYTKATGNHSFEIGLFGLAASTYPGRDTSTGKDQILDLGLDAQYQLFAGKHDITALFSTIHESQDWDASHSLGNTSNRSDDLWSTKVTLDYLYDKTYGGAISYFLSNGKSDPLLYPDSPNGSPTSDGLVLQLNYMPINKSGGPAFWSKSNVKFSVQYIIYSRFNGTHTNASDNNTLYLESWIAF